MELKLESSVDLSKGKTDGHLKFGDLTVMITPSMKWVLRVQLNEHQAIVGFHKFYTIGIGFEEEDDWNTNLPYQSDTQEIWNHISHNKAYDDISDEDCIKAIKIIQEAVEDHKELFGLK
jgi:hypothetical protein